MIRSRNGARLIPSRSHGFHVLWSPRGAARDSKSAFTRVYDALCVAGDPVVGPQGLQLVIMGPCLRRDDGGLEGMPCRFGSAC